MSDEVETVKKLSPFDFLNSINAGSRGVNLMEHCSAEINEDGDDPTSNDKSYVPFIVNRSLSYHADTVLFANVMNQYSILPNKMQYDFLRHVTRPGKRFAKWVKNEPATEDIKMLMKLYDYSELKAREAITLLKEEDLEELRIKTDVGGRKGNKSTKKTKK